MLRVLFAIILIYSGNSVYSQSLKSITIGNKYAGPRNIETTVGDYNGTLTIGRLNDGTVYSFHFISKNALNSRNEIPHFISGADNFLDKISRDYEITLNSKYWKHREFQEGNMYDVATCSNDSISFLVSFSYSLYENFSTILFTVTHERLSKKGANEHLLDDRKEF